MALPAIDNNTRAPELADIENNKDFIEKDRVVKNEPSEGLGVGVVS